MTPSLLSHLVKTSKRYIQQGINTFDLDLKLSVLSNGLRIASVDTGHPTMSLGVYLGCGSRTEIRENNGCAHFLEHMAFKGTHTRTQRDIEYEIENMGGKLNAYTSREMTCYYSKILTIDNNVEKMVGLLADIMLNSKYDEGKINMEKDVILQEYDEVNKIPMEFAFDELHKICYNVPNKDKMDMEDFTDNPLGFTILGPVENIKNMTRASLIHYINNNYFYKDNSNGLSATGSIMDKHKARVFDNMLITAVGGVKSHDSLTELCGKYFHDKNNNLDKNNYLKFADGSLINKDKLGSNNLKSGGDHDNGNNKIIHQDIVNERIEKDNATPTTNTNANNKHKSKINDFNYGSEFGDEVFDENFGKNNDTKKTANRLDREDLELNTNMSYFTGREIKVIRNPVIWKTHIALGYEGVKNTGKDLWKYYIASTIIGKWNITEGEGEENNTIALTSQLRKVAWANQSESYMSFNTNYRETGLFGVYMVCSPQSANEMLKSYKEELSRAAVLTDDLLVNKIKQQFVLDVQFSLDGNTEIAEEISKQLLLNPQPINLDKECINSLSANINFNNVSDIIETIKSITAQDIKDVFKKLIDSDCGVIVYGTVDENIIDYETFKSYKPANFN